MAAAQKGDGALYRRLLEQVRPWLKRYFGARLPPAMVDDAVQDTLVALHEKRNSYDASRPFGPWLVAIARYKWIDRVRDASRFVILSLDAEIPVEDHGESTISAAALDKLLGRLKPAQASVIRLVKLRGLSIAHASGATGQSAALVKINIHRGLKKLTALVS